MAAGPLRGSASRPDRSSEPAAAGDDQCLPDQVRQPHQLASGVVHYPPELGEDGEPQPLGPGITALDVQRRCLQQLQQVEGEYPSASSELALSLPKGQAQQPQPSRVGPEAGTGIDPRRQADSPGVIAGTRGGANDDKDGAMTALAGWPVEVGFQQTTVRCWKADGLHDRLGAQQVEGSIGKEHWRSKVIPRSFDEKSAINVCFASLLQAS